MGVSEDSKPIERDTDTIRVTEDKGVILYHRVFAKENFEASARMLLKLVNNAQMQYPGQKRTLYVDIEGHRNDQGGFDAYMMTLQKEFCLGFLMKYLSKIQTPLIAVENKNQSDDVPKDFEIADIISKK